MKKGVKKLTFEFRKELKRSMVTAITAATGIILAFSWKETLNEYLKEILELSPIHGKLITSIIITILSVIILIMVSKYASIAKLRKIPDDD